MTRATHPEIMPAQMEDPTVTKIARIQQEPTQAGTPRPYDIVEPGDVLDQPFWKGTPARLMGFQRHEEVQQIDVPTGVFWDDPQRAVGMLPVFMDAQGDLYTSTPAVESVTAAEAE